MTDLSKAPKETGPTVEIVPYQPRHADAWRTLNEAWIGRFFTIEPKDRLVLDDPEGQIIAPGGAILMAERDGQPIGCCALMNMADGGFELAKMAVDDTAKGLGIGRRLMDAAVETARSRGAHRIYIETNSSLAPALALYRSTGFIDLPPRPTPYARCDTWMELRLT